MRSKNTKSEIECKFLLKKDDVLSEKEYITIVGDEDLKVSGEVEAEIKEISEVE